MMAHKRLKLLSLVSLMSAGFAAPAAMAQQSFVPAEQAPAPRAIQCSAALELMARAAPRWSNQALVQNARSYWRSEADRLAQATRRDSKTEIGQEMGLLAEQAVQRPNALSQRATFCLGDVPSTDNAPQQRTQQRYRTYRR